MTDTDTGVTPTRTSSPTYSRGSSRRSRPAARAAAGRLQCRGGRGPFSLPRAGRLVRSALFLARMSVGDARVYTCTKLHAMRTPKVGVGPMEFKLYAISGVLWCVLWCPAVSCGFQTHPNDPWHKSVTWPNYYPMLNVDCVDWRHFSKICLIFSSCSKTVILIKKMSYSLTAGSMEVYFAVQYWTFVV